MPWGEKMGLEPPRGIGRVSKPLCCCLSAAKAPSSDDEQDCSRDLGLGDGLGCKQGQQKRKKEKAELVKWIKQVCC